MKTLIFILLKIAEIIGAIGAYFMIALGGNYIIILFYEENVLCKYGGWSFAFGIMAIFAIAFIGSIIYLLCQFVSIWMCANKKWSQNIYDKLKK